MATKSVTITTEAYDRLASFKKSSESFSDVINRVVGTRSLLGLAGTLSNAEAEALEKHITDIRNRMRERVNDR